MALSSAGFAYQAAVPDGPSVPGATPEGIAFFEQKIRPVLVQHCYSCHSQAASAANSLKAGLYLDTAAGIAAGGESGPVVLPGKSAESPLLSAIRYEAWLFERFRQHRSRTGSTDALRPDGRVWWDGEEQILRVEAQPEGGFEVLLGALRFHLETAEGDLRKPVETVLRKRAGQFLPGRLRELAQQHGLDGRLRSVSIRNQKTRWGSCSPRGLICLNWRLMQVPDWVRDYILLHELAHLRHLNHSRSFWSEVERLCPKFKDAEAWLKRSGKTVL